MRKLITAREAADLLGLSPATLKNKARAGQIPRVSEGRGSPIRFRLCDIEAYADHYTSVPAPLRPTLQVGLNKSVLKAMEGVR